MNAEICILAGGLGRRMGRDKSRLRLGGKSFLTHVRQLAAKTGCPARVIRRDLVPRCGPLGGVCTALMTTRADTVLFLACDMPLMSLEVVNAALQSFPRCRAIFTRSGAGGPAGFPFRLHRSCLAAVEKQIAQRNYSLQKLAAGCRAKIVNLKSTDPAVFNVNTPADLKAARKILPRSS